MKLMLLGEAPNEATCGIPRLWLRPDDSGIQHAANRLRDFAGWTTRQYLRVFPVRDNLLHEAPPRASTAGYTFPMAQARAQVPRVFDKVEAEGVDGVLILGVRLSRCFQWCEPPVAFEWTEVHHDDRSFRAVHVPHPSGMNRWWNDETNRRKAHEFLTGLAGSSSGSA